jgi:hypothetical protein
VLAEHEQLKAVAAGRTAAHHADRPPELLREAASAPSSGDSAQVALAALKRRSDIHCELRATGDKGHKLT